jgi:beta-phosphoglucomutase-like phosphatase (HAD superfamily)
MAETVPSKKGWADRIDEPVHASDDVDVGDITGKLRNNKAVDRDRASKLANLLEGLEFPATKEEIRNHHLNRRSPAMDDTVNDVIEVINNLDDRREYGSVYDVEMAADLVEQAGKKPYVRDRVHRKRIGQKPKPDPYTGRERIWPANARDVSPNTPKGEDV